MKKLTYIFLLLLFLGSCSTIKYVKEHEQLLTKNTIIVDNNKHKNNKLNQYLTQKSNAKTLGLPLSLYFYNIGNPYGSTEVEEWSLNNPKLYKTFSRLFSEKQGISIAESFVGLNNWFLRNGQPPIIINSDKTKKSVRNLHTYFQNNGYFKSKVWAKTDTLGKRKGAVTYYISKGKPLFLDTISKNIKSPVLDSLYNLEKHKSFLKPNKQYNNQDFINEAERITKLFRNKGIYHFNTNSIGFFDIDTSKYKTNVNLEIENRIIEKDRNYIEKPYKIQRIKNINVYTDYSYNIRNDKISVSKQYNGINFHSFGKLKYNPKYLSQYIFLKPNQIYTDSLRNLSKKYIRSLKNFKTTNIRYKELNDEELEANIYLTPTEKYTLSVGTEVARSNIRQYDISANASLTNRNIFKGAEIFNFSVSGSYFQASNGPGWKIGGDLSLEVPRFMAPFSWNRLIPKSMFPKTKFFVGTSVQKNIGLDKQNFNLGVNFKWNRNKRKKIKIELLNTEYIRNLNRENYFSIYSSEYKKIKKLANIYNYTEDIISYKGIRNFLQTITSNNSFKNSNLAEYKDALNIFNRYNIITSDFLIPVIAYNFTYNSQDNYKNQNFSYFKFRLANSGNFLGFLTKKTDHLNRTVLFETPIAQYFKIDVEYKKFWRISDKSTLGIRGFAGFILPYNNSSIPFSKSYFSGGSNDIRAWRTYDLGPGTRPQGLEYNIGNLKLLGNIEYRFDIIGDLKGALFIDGGNIWDTTYSPTDDKSKFKKLKTSLTDIAIGSGFGIRYDLKFLVARLDLGFKVREPYLNSPWLQNFNFNSAVYNIGINYPF
ncbi:MAG: hypothetical protein KGV59_05575 [Tenacibaculum sp.]|nr:hypothetical protein [Tenacibaculum sp.]